MDTTPIPANLMGMMRQFAEEAQAVTLALSRPGRDLV